MKVFLLPYNIASDVSHKVRALKSIGINARGLVFGSSKIQTTDGIKILDDYPIDGLKRRLVQIKNVKAVYQGIMWADIVHWTFRFDILPRKMDERIIKFFDKPRVVQWYGSDIRNPEIESAINPFYRETYKSDYEYTDESAEFSLNNQKNFARLGFVPLEFAEMAHYVDRDLFPVSFQTRQTIVLADYEPLYPDAQNPKPLIVHSPSAPFAKGTKYVLQAVESLKARYDFEFVLVENLPREEALKIMRRCDVYVDQLIIGSHGYAAVEAMAFGKPVICYLSPTIEKVYSPEIPIVNANPETIKEKLEILVKDAVLRFETGKKSRIYAEKYHDDKKVARDLADIYREVTRLHRESRKKSDG